MLIIDIRRGPARFLVPLLLAASASQARAQTAVQFNGVVAQSCILTVGTSGALGVSSNSGTQLGSELPGGSPATLSVTATAGAPTILFSAPTMPTKPVAYTGTPTISISYSSAGGANQAYTSSSSHYTSTNALLDTITINAKAVDASGFAAGSYQLRTTATCQQ